MAEGGFSTALPKTGSEPEEKKINFADLKGWSSQVEDLVDAGDADGAVNLLKKVVESLQLRDDADSNLGLAAAFTDLGGVYASQGLSLKSDECFTSALLIKQRRTQKPAEVLLESWENVVHAPDTGEEKRGSAQSASNWEAATSELPTLKNASSAFAKQDLPANNKTNVKQKQRGRGSFTYGGAGMYSDNLDGDGAGDEDGQRDGTLSDHSLNGGADHVVVISGFSPKLKTKDLEDLVKPYSKQGGCTLRWIDDTTTLAVFRTPALAREALTGISDPRFKVGVYNESSRAYGLASEKDLQPPAARPASTARVAQRMIAGALSQQGVRQALMAKGRTSAEEVKKQERQRRERLQTRAQLRDEAWGSDDD
ncbi:hypothetical protein AXG93_115s1580 [Marchantia polymorpha subsp. ruderalis]|uniref:Coiled-coil domain-containing protein R3HCC1L n=1 Tax=Marchantia polymorpha subsp. ruderalis TaxID=1480154 RepID=A0A176W5X4_MARPO|nr:hypothetical protein AXG93_115s1580 [Marchantia polymorpha subsp. ruderalis]